MKIIPESVPLTREFSIFFCVFFVPFCFAQTMAKLRLVPLAPEEVDSRVSNFRSLADDVRRNIPDVLLAMMNILYKKHSHAKYGLSSSAFIDGWRRDACVFFARLREPRGASRRALERTQCGPIGI